MMPFLPAGLKSLATEGATYLDETEKFEAEYPELYKQIRAKHKQVDATVGIQATVDAPKDPSTIKYTEEGTLVHVFMKQLLVLEKRMVAVQDLEYTLTDNHKAKIKAEIIEKYSAYGTPQKYIDLEIAKIPNKTKIGHPLNPPAISKKDFMEWYIEDGLKDMMTK